MRERTSKPSVVVCKTLAFGHVYALDSIVVVKINQQTLAPLVKLFSDVFFSIVSALLGNVSRNLQVVILNLSIGDTGVQAMGQIKALYRQMCFTLILPVNGGFGHSPREGISCDP